MAAESDRHLDEEQIERYSLGNLPEEEWAARDAHLLICETCRWRVEESDSYISAMRHAAGELRRNVLIRERRPWLALPRLIPVLAGLMLVALLALSWRGGWFRNPDASPVAVALTAARGAEIEATAPAGAPLNLRPDLTALPTLPSYRLEIVDRYGDPVWRGSFPASAVTHPMNAGIYFVRIYSPQGELYREYGLRVE
ncbi:MAG: hypothetical protein LAQ30_06230 [Acidobacteriia bacterium]|nr:hypothetical protein [Terriglobia bacterium]